MNDTDSPVQYREPCLYPFDGEPGSPQLTRAQHKNIGNKYKRHKKMPQLKDNRTQLYTHLVKKDTFAQLTLYSSFSISCSH